jgi:hypothetical protein
MAIIPIYHKIIQKAPLKDEIILIAHGILFSFHL